MKRFLFLFMLSHLISLNAVLAQSFSISGQVLHHNGDPIPGVTVTCSNGSFFITDLNGSFIFSNLESGNDFEINASYDTNLYEGLTVLDATYLRYMILQVVDFPNTQWLTADFDQNGIYQGLDYIRLVNAVTKVENPSVEYFVEDHAWRFFDNDINSVTNLNNIETGISIENLSADINDLQLIGVKSGNVSFEKDHVPPPPTAPHPVFYIPDLPMVENEEIVVSFKVRDMRGIIGWQHAISWDNNYLEFINHNGLINYVDLYPNEETVENGLLRMMGINIDINQIEDDSTIYEIRFNALQDANSLSDIIDFDTSVFDNQIIYVEDINFYILEAELNVGELSMTATHDLTNLVLFEIHPNPTFEDLYFSIQLDQSKKSIVSLYDSTGKLIQQESFNSQLINDKMNIHNLPKGVYYLQLRNENGINSQSFIKL